MPLSVQWDVINTFFHRNKDHDFAFYRFSDGRLIAFTAVAQYHLTGRLWRGSVNKREQFTTWDEVYKLRDLADSLGLGPCYCPTEDARVVIFDFDGYEGDNATEEAQHIVDVEWLVAEALRHSIPVERSRSGRGYHAILRGDWTNRMDHMPRQLGEVFGHGQHINLTGHFLPIPTPHMEGGAFDRGRSYLAMAIKLLFGGEVKDKRAELEGIEYEETEARGRKLNLTDDQVIRQLELTHDKYALDLFYVGGLTSNHSREMFALACAFDRITGDPDQVIRLLARSALYQHDPEDAKGEDRIKKFERNARKGFMRIRRRNNERPLFATLNRGDTTAYVAAIEQAQEIMRNGGTVPHKPFGSGPKREQKSKGPDPRTAMLQFACPDGRPLSLNVYFSDRAIAPKAAEYFTKSNQIFAERVTETDIRLCSAESGELVRFTYNVTYQRGETTEDREAIRNALLRVMEGNTPCAA